jgi:RHS repeat-associated protein
MRSREAKYCAGAYKYKYNGKELQDELGLNLYDYGARNYDPALGRFFSIDRMSEMFMNLSTYQYAGNTPTYFIDRNGEYIDISDPNGKDKYRYQNGQTQKKQEDGSYKTIDASECLSDFVFKVIAGLNGLENSGKTGKSYIDGFSGEKNSVTFEYSGGRDAEASNGKISLDPNAANKSWTTQGYISTPLFVTIGHEMEHLVSKNSINFETWYKRGVYKAEIGATHIENKIRAESGLPLRTHYGGNSKGPFEISRLIDNEGNSIYYGMNGGRYLYSNTPQNEQTQATINDISKASKGVILNSRYNYNGQK